MKTISVEYFLVLHDRNERDPVASPDDDTAAKPFESELLPPFGKPLVFLNGLYDHQKAAGISPIDPPPDVLFCGSDLLVKTSIRDALLPLKIPELAIQPAIFIDHKGDWHENYWYLTFLSMLDCWDRAKSTYFADTAQMDGIPAHTVYRYALNEKTLGELPLKSRLLFKIGGTSEGHIVAHSSLADLFRKPAAAVVPIADYGVSWP